MGAHIHCGRTLSYSAGSDCFDAMGHRGSNRVVCSLLTHLMLITGFRTDLQRLSKMRCAGALHRHVNSTCLTLAKNARITKVTKFRFILQLVHHPLQSLNRQNLPTRSCIRVPRWPTSTPRVLRIRRPWIDMVSLRYSSG